MSIRGIMAGIAGAVFLTFSPANAALTGETVVDVTFDLGAAGLTPSLLGSTGVTAGGLLSFPITGGDLTTGQIEHDGSGVRLAATATPTTFVDLENFLIDISTPTAATIAADITTSMGASLSGIPIFSFDLTGVADPFDIINPSISLLFTLAASELIVTYFGIAAPTDALAGLQFGLAGTAPAPIPLPAAAWVFLAGAAGLGAMRHRKRELVAA